MLVGHLLTRVAKKYDRAIGLGREAQGVLETYTWPGNVLQLEQTIERAVIVAKGREIQVTDLPEYVFARNAPEVSRTPPAGEPQTMTLAVRERETIIEALKTTGWNKDAAAPLLGLHRPTLYSKMQKHGIALQRPR